MAYWAFTSVTQPNFDTGLVAVPTSATDVDTTNPIGLISVDVSNPTAVAITYTLTNGAGVPIIPTIEIPANMDFQRVYVSKKCAGLKVQAGASGLYHQIAALK